MLDIYNSLNIIIVSDHGMTDVSTQRVILLDDYINLDDFDIVLGPSVTGLNLKSNKTTIDLPKHINHLTIFPKNRIPKKYHFINEDSPDYLVLADEGWFISTKLNIKTKKSFPLGMHGYNSKYKSMHGIFMANGPLFNKGVEVDSFENINIYPILCHILNIDPYRELDNDPWNHSIIQEIIK